MGRTRSLFLTLLLLCAALRGAPLQQQSPTDLDRVQVGSHPPEFLLRDLDGRTHSLKQYEGKKNIVLIFYRGHW